MTFAAYDVVDSEDSQYAAAWTSPTDTFTRGAGRAISRTRLLTGGAQYVHEFTPFSSDYVDFWGTVFSDAAQYAPSRWSNVQISFSGGRPERMYVGPNDSRVAECSFEGGDGCLAAERYTIDLIDYGVVVWITVEADADFPETLNTDAPLGN